MATYFWGEKSLLLTLTYQACGTLDTTITILDLHITRWTMIDMECITYPSPILGLTSILLRVTQWTTMVDTILATTVCITNPIPTSILMIQVTSEIPLLTHDPADRKILYVP